MYSGLSVFFLSSYLHVPYIIFMFVKAAKYNYIISIPFWSFWLQRWQHRKVFHSFAPMDCWQRNVSSWFIPCISQNERPKIMQMWTDSGTTTPQTCKWWGQFCVSETSWRKQQTYYSGMLDDCRLVLLVCNINEPSITVQDPPSILHAPQRIKPPKNGNKWDRETSNQIQ